MSINTPIRWGILGPGNITRPFARGLQSLPDARIQAVGSRTQEKADAFGDEFGVPTRHASYEALASDPDVDVIYIATPHPFHEENALLCLEHGKAVLVEKPFAINAAQAERVVAKAREKKLFLMEAMWSRFFPLMGHLRQRLAEGVIGDPRMLRADFGFRSGINPEGRLFNPALGGGSLLDVGIYPLSLASMFFGEPDQIAGVAEMGETGTDLQAGMTLRYPGGRIAFLATAVRTNTPQDADLMGTDGWIRLHSPWWKLSRITVHAAGKEEEVIEVPFESSGMSYEAQEVMNCLREGRTESAVMPLDETLALMRTMDTLRAQWGLKYPTE